MDKFCCLDFPLEELEEESTMSSSQDNLLGMMGTAKYDSTQLPQLPTAKKVGRKEAPTTQMFAKLHTKNGKALKKEYVRCQIIRGIKKCARYLAEGRKPEKGIHSFPVGDYEKMRIWQGIEQLVSHCPGLFASLGNTCEGPATDGKVIRKRQRMETPEFRSFNDDYCRHFYQSELVRQFHYYYLQLVYGTGIVDPKAISEKLAVFCCDGNHTSECIKIWEEIRQYVMFGMIEQLRLEPFGTHEDFEMTMLPAGEDIMEYREDSMPEDPDFYLV